MENEILERTRVPALDAILGKKFPVLDDGFIRLIDYMGDDSSIVQAARVSYGAGTKKLSEDTGLIRYLMRHRHTTPFEMCELKIHVRVPMDCWRQWIRHRTASVNEYSTRYSDAIDSMQKTHEDEWRLQGKGNKQGSEGFLKEWTDEQIAASIKTYGQQPPIPPGESLSEVEADFHGRARRVYEMRLKYGVAREQARKDLPLSTYTEAYWKIDLKNLLGFLSLRMDSHAQKEIRDYATIIGEQIVALWVPTAWQAFKDYRMNSMGLTSRDIEIIQSMEVYTPNLDMDKNNRTYWHTGHIANSFGWLAQTKSGKLKRNRERSECEAKLTKLGIEIPWK